IDNFDDILGEFES
nr:Chain D, Dna Polymerase Alpha Catalytic Subunit A [Saccharomyces cerevisiae]4C93_E Chain E, Dna Polymerase Alpha Catalytic Subunit A [Saccharomyces cerevisiae]